MRPVTRRDLLWCLALGLPTCAVRASFGATQRGAWQNSLSKGGLFEIVPPSVSGISWRHSNGRSPEYYLPETTGAGCAFLDYDNDGWMDIYLVNSGKCDCFDPQPPLRNALYHNNRGGTFTDVTEKAGVAGGGYGMESPSETTTGMGLPIST
jgi:FG-GAP-like repeat